MFTRPVDAASRFSSPKANPLPCSRFLPSRYSNSELICRLQRSIYRIHIRFVFPRTGIESRNPEANLKQIKERSFPRHRRRSPNRTERSPGDLIRNDNNQKVHAVTCTTDRAPEELPGSGPRCLFVPHGGSR
jgi:hypothetical protein